MLRLQICLLFVGCAAAGTGNLVPLAAAEPLATLPPGVVLEAEPTEAKQTKIVLIAGPNFYKAGEHEYIAGCALLADLLRQTPEVFPVLAVGWPKKPETLAGARAVVMLFDGGEKHALVDPALRGAIEKLAASGCGLVGLHQTIDFPAPLGDQGLTWLGGVWEKGTGERAHWVAEFKTFPAHAITRGVQPFAINDGWLSKLRFAPDLAGVTPLLRTAAPKAAAARREASDAIVSFAFERSSGGRSFVFTGGHLHESFAQEGYRRFLVNGVLWAAGREIPPAGAPVKLEETKIKSYLSQTPPAVGK